MLARGGESVKDDEKLAKALSVSFFEGQLS